MSQECTETDELILAGEENDWLFFHHWSGLVFLLILASSKYFLSSIVASVMDVRCQVDSSTFFIKWVPNTYWSRWFIFLFCWWVAVLRRAIIGIFKRDSWCFLSQSSYNALKSSFVCKWQFLKAWIQQGTNNWSIMCLNWWKSTGELIFKVHSQSTR